MRGCESTTPPHPASGCVFAKKASGLPTVSYNDAVEEALCFGWIDGLMRPVDDAFYMQLFTPRKPKSAWAQSNKTRVARLIDAGLMTPAGLAAIEAAKACGSWDALTAVESLTVPPELRKAINANARAKKHWPRIHREPAEAVPLLPGERETRRDA